MILETTVMMWSMLLIEALPDEETTSHGIFLTEDSIQKNSHFFTVIKAWPKVTLVKEGDVVVIGMFSGDPVTLDGRNFKIVGEHNLLWIIWQTAPSATTNENPSGIS